MSNDTTKIGAPTEKKRPAKEGRTYSPQDKKTIRTILIRTTEVVIIAFIGSMIGIFFNGKVIQEDCDRLGVSKVGDTYINCSIIVPHKDSPAIPPR